jgi:hypothetical protein
MSNQILLTAESIRKYFDRYEIEETVELPILGKVLLSVKDIQFFSDRLSLPIHHKIKIVPDFEISFGKFEFFGNRLSFEIDRVGVIPGFGVEILCELLFSVINRRLGRSGVELKANRISVDYIELLPDKLRDLLITRIQTDNTGINIEFSSKLIEVIRKSLEFSSRPIILSIDCKDG